VSSATIGMIEQPEIAAERGFWVALQRDLALAMESKGELLQALAFMAIVVSLFPLAVGPESALLKRIAPGVVWVASLLAVLLTLPRLFASDYQDGTLEQLLLSPFPLAVICAGKVFAHWLTTGLPLAILAPVLGLQYGLAGDELGILVASLMLGTPVLSMLGAIGAALTLGVRGGSILMALLVLPLFVPVIIFGAGAVEQSMAAMDSSANLSLLGACLLAGAVFTPIATATALRISLD
jgi:heme exporter protein B